MNLDDQAKMSRVKNVGLYRVDTLKASG